MHHDVWRGGGSYTSLAKKRTASMGEEEKWKAPPNAILEEVSTGEEASETSASNQVCKIAAFAHESTFIPEKQGEKKARAVDAVEIG